MENITRERALEIKEFLDSIKDVLSDPMANKLWAIHLEVYNPTFRESPCTCQPSAWVALINNLKRDINQLLQETEVVVTQEILPVDDISITLTEENTGELKQTVKERKSKKLQ